MSKLGLLNRIELSGFKSIERMDLELSSLNVLIGQNGAGKSNFIGFFRFMKELQSRNLQYYVSASGKAETLLHFGSKKTSEIKIRLFLSPDDYEAVLAPTSDNRLVFKSEQVNHLSDQGSAGYVLAFSGAEETGLGQRHIPAVADDNLSQMASRVTKSIGDWKIYHFHDTSDTAKVKKDCNIHDNLALAAQGDNLAAFLYSMKGLPEYQNIVQTIQRVAPFFHDFILQPDKTNPEQIRLRWKHKGSDAYFDANSLSDGTLRFMCLATLLLQPGLPTILLLDEPELGLHPYAVQLLGAMLKSASAKTQVIVSTQSVTLANQFDWKDIIIVEEKDDASSFRRLKEQDVKIWLDDYRMGDLWEKNLIGGTS